jgi:hypothetical protein
MKEPKKNIEIDLRNPEIVIIDGKKYIQKRITTKKIGKTTHWDKAILEPMDETTFEKDIDYIVDKLKEQTSTDEILRDLLKHALPSELKSIVKKLKAGNKPIKQKGCIGFEIGGKYLEITP